MKKHLTLFVFAILLAFKVLPAQNYVTLGADTTANGLYEHPTPYGTHYSTLRVQYLIMAPELISLGLQPGEIHVLAFNVKQANNCSAMPGFTIKLKHTSVAELGTVFENDGFTTTFYAASFQPQQGWNTHTFSNPFYWDGSSNLLVDVCYDLTAGPYTQNASVFYSSTPGKNTGRFFRSTSIQACGTTQAATPSFRRANMRLWGNVSECIPPSNLHVTNLTTSSATARWTPSGSENIWNLKYGAMGFNPSQGGTLVQNIATNHFTINGLTPETTYDFYVKALCDSLPESNWSGPYTFTTNYFSYSTPFYQSFPSATFPVNWTQTYSGGLTANLWLLNNSSFAGGSPYEMRSKWVTQTGLSRLITPMINLSDAGSATLEFKHFYDDWSPGCTLKIQSSADGINWTDEAFSFQSGYGNIGPATITIPITTLSETTRIAWVMDGNHDGIDFWYIDDVHVSAELNIMPGDANCDGSVNLLDLITISNRILNLNPQPFCFDDADVNQDGIINLLDMIDTVNIILN